MSPFGKLGLMASMLLVLMLVVFPVSGQKSLGTAEQMPYQLRSDGLLYSGSVGDGWSRYVYGLVLENNSTDGFLHWVQLEAEEATGDVSLGRPMGDIGAYVETNQGIIYPVDFSLYQPGNLIYPENATESIAYLPAMGARFMGNIGGLDPNFDVAMYPYVQARYFPMMNPFSREVGFLGLAAYFQVPDGMMATRMVIPGVSIFDLGNESYFNTQPGLYDSLGLGAEGSVVQLSEHLTLQIGSYIGIDYWSGNVDGYQLDGLIVNGTITSDDPYGDQVVPAMSASLITDDGSMLIWLPESWSSPSSVGPLQSVSTFFFFDVPTSISENWRGSEVYLGLAVESTGGIIAHGFRLRLRPPAVIELQPDSRFSVGTIAQLLSPNWVLVRNEPGIDSYYSSWYADTIVTIIDGPVIKDGYIWWLVQQLDSSNSGWVTESENGIQTMVPTPAVQIDHRATVTLGLFTLHEEPRMDSQGEEFFGGIVTVLEGPIEQGGNIWWRVRMDTGSGPFFGWVTQEMDGIQTLVGMV